MFRESCDMHRPVESMLPPIYGDEIAISTRIKAVTALSHLQVIKSTDMGEEMHFLLRKLLLLPNLLYQWLKLT